MKFNLFKSESQAFPRCEHRSPSGRQCSQPVCASDPQFCGTHKPTPEQLAAAELAQAAGTLSSREDVHRLLTAVTLLRIRGWVTPKEASVYAYLGQQLLRGLREIDHFNELQAEREERNRAPRELTWNLPRPDRSDPPEPTTTDSPAVHSPATPSVGSSTNLPLSTPPAAASASKSVTSESSTSSTSLTSSTSPTSILPPTLNPPFDPRHFFPIDPTLPRGSQDLDRNIPPPDEAECRRLAARRGLLFNRRRPAPSGALR